VLCNPGDASDLARKLRDLLLDPGRASQLGRQGRDVVLQKFSIGRMAQEMSDLYRSVLAKRR
jgi:glycosyltransferase involved in cell wall biosynthesis